MHLSLLVRHDLERLVAADAVEALQQLAPHPGRIVIRLLTGALQRCKHRPQRPQLLVHLVAERTELEPVHLGVNFRRQTLHGVPPLFLLAQNETKVGKMR